MASVDEAPPAVVPAPVTIEPPPPVFDFAQFKQQQNELNKEKKIHIGHINTKAEPDGKFSTYFTESEMKQWVDVINKGAKGGTPIPLRVLHMIKRPEKFGGGELRPIGEFLWAEIDKETGRTRAACVIYDGDPLAEYCKKIIGESEGVAEDERMYEFSMGLQFEPGKDENGMTTIKDKKLVEISLCSKGDKPGTHIEKSVNMSSAFRVLPIPPKLQVAPGTQQKFVYPSPHYDAKNMAGKRDLDMEYTRSAIEMVNKRRREHNGVMGYINTLVSQSGKTREQRPPANSLSHHSQAQPRDQSTGRFIAANASRDWSIGHVELPFQRMDVNNGLLSMGGRQTGWGMGGATAAGGGGVAYGSTNFNYHNIKAPLKNAKVERYYPNRESFADGCMSILGKLTYNAPSGFDNVQPRPGYNGRVIRGNASGSNDVVPMEVDNSVSSSSAPAADTAPVLVPAMSAEEAQKIADLKKRTAETLEKLKKIGAENPAKAASGLTKVGHDQQALVSEISHLNVPPEPTEEELAGLSERQREMVKNAYLSDVRRANEILEGIKKKSDQERAFLEKQIDDNFTQWNQTLTQNGQAPIDMASFVRAVVRSTDTSDPSHQPLKQLVTASAMRDKALKEEVQGTASVIEDIFQHTHTLEKQNLDLRQKLEEANKKLRNSSGVAFANPEDKYKNDPLPERDLSDDQRKPAYENRATKTAVNFISNAQEAAELLRQMPRTTQIYAREYVDSHPEYKISAQHLLTQARMFTSEKERYFVPLEPNQTSLKAVRVYGPMVKDRLNGDMTPLFKLDNNSARTKNELLRTWDEMKALPGFGTVPPVNSSFFH